jgi:hypothetical protein
MALRVEERNNTNPDQLTVAEGYYRKEVGGAREVGPLERCRSRVSTEQEEGPVTVAEVR